jgi:predicted oxidoreductase (fatty acid repression mutant protein)
MAHTEKVSATVPSKDPVTRARIARIAAHTRWQNTPQEVQQDRRELEVQRVEDYIKRLVDEAPPLTNEQRDRLVVLLRGAPDKSAAA